MQGGLGVRLGLTLQVPRSQVPGFTFKLSKLFNDGFATEPFAHDAILFEQPMDERAARDGGGLGQRIPQMHRDRARVQSLPDRRIASRVPRPEIAGRFSRLEREQNVALEDAGALAWRRAVDHA